MRFNDRMKAQLGNFMPSLVTARRRKLQQFGRTTRRIGSLARTAMHGSVDGEIVREMERTAKGYLVLFFLLVSYVGERLWWPIQSPTKEERRKRKAKRRGRSSLLILDLKDGKS